MQFALRRAAGGLLARPAVQRVADERHPLLHRRPLPGAGGRRNAPRTDPDALFAADARRLGQRLEGRSLPVSAAAVLEPDALDEILLRLLRLSWFWQGAVLGHLRQRAEGAEGLRQILGLPVILQLPFDGL